MEMDILLLKNFRCCICVEQNPGGVGHDHASKPYIVSDPRVTSAGGQLDSPRVNIDIIPHL